MVYYVVFGLVPDVCYVAIRFQKVVMTRFHDKVMMEENYYINQ